MKIIIEDTDKINLIPNFALDTLEMFITNCHSYLHSQVKISLCTSESVNEYFQYYVQLYITLKKRVQDGDVSIVSEHYQKVSYEIACNKLETLLNSDNRLYLEMIL